MKHLATYLLIDLIYTAKDTSEQYCIPWENHEIMPGKGDVIDLNTPLGVLTHIDHREFDLKGRSVYLHAKIHAETERQYRDYQDDLYVAGFECLQNAS
jgi:hypothetical protein